MQGPYQLQDEGAEDAADRIVHRLHRHADRADGEEHPPAQHGYPTGKQEKTTQTVLEQAAVLSEAWVAA